MVRLPAVQLGIGRLRHPIGVAVVGLDARVAGSVPGGGPGRHCRLAAARSTAGEQTGLRRQVWLTGDFEGAPFINDLSPGATLYFLDDDARLPRQFFSARWQGYWYVPSSQIVTLHVDADDYAAIWIDGELRFARSTFAARGIRLDAGVHELRIDYQQYGGTLQLSLRVARAGAYPRPLRTEQLFPDPPEPAMLQLVAVSGWLRAVVPLTWAAGALALGFVALWACPGFVDRLTLGITS